ncbi:MAG: pyruvate kinase [Alphaproteobacteria bacterium]|nr:pyruvate kinase [Alphaproteobacteria bacterium]
MSATRIVCTIGPVTQTPEAVRALAQAGMSVARFNGSHGTLEWHKEAIAVVRAAAPGIPVLLDIPGRKIRTGALAVEPFFKAGENIVLTTEPGHDGSRKVPITNDRLHLDLSAGDQILADDGTLRFTVLSVVGNDITCKAENAGQLRSRKGINVPHVRLRGDLITPRDHQLVEFAHKNGVDFIGISFVESAVHVEAVRELAGDWPRIVSKVESRGGVDNLEEIAAATDAIMIDRGDLSVETSLADVAIMQKRILDAGARHGKPVIVATEMLHTMIANPFPTKAEVSDITQAVLDGCAATMLSGETAVGAYPVDAVRCMRQVAAAAECHMQAELDGRRPASDAAEPNALAEATALLCRELPITKIVVFTRSGFAARLISARRPRQPIIAVSDDAMAARSFNLFAGTTGCHTRTKFTRTSTEHIVAGLEEMWRAGVLNDADVILVTGRSYSRAGHRMNLIQVHHISDLAETLKWRRES